MRYFRYSEPSQDEQNTHAFYTVSEQEILDTYWQSWYTLMCKKYTKEVVDQEYTVEDCIKGWQTVHWAWQVDDCQKESELDLH